MVQAIARAMKLLRLLAEQPDGLRLGELAERSQLKYATVYNLMRALESEQLAVRASGRRWTLGDMARGIGLTEQDHCFYRAAWQLIVRLSGEFPDSYLTFSQYRDTDLQAILYACVSRDRAIGDRIHPLPAYSTAAGVVYFAYAPFAQIRRFIRRRPFQATAERPGWFSLTEFEHAVWRCRQNGYAALPWGPESEMRIAFPLCRGDEFGGIMTVSRPHVTPEEKQRFLERVSALGNILPETEKPAAGLQEPGRLA